MGLSKELQEELVKSADNLLDWAGHVLGSADQAFAEMEQDGPDLKKIEEHLINIISDGENTVKRAEALLEIIIGHQEE